MRGGKTAPQFDGKAAHLDRYFRDVMDVGEETERTTDDELIRIALRYLDIDDEQLWSRKVTNNMTYDGFKNEIKLLYPGSDGEKLYTWTDLREVVRVNAANPPAGREEFGTYQRNFQRIADFLKSKNKISEREMNEIFMKGIHPDFRFRVLQRLQIVKHDQPSDEPYAMKDVIEAAEWAIDGVPGAIYREPDEDTSYIKKEMVDLSNTVREMGRQFTAQIQTLSRAQESSAPRNVGPPRRPQGATYQNHEAPPRWNQNQPQALPPQNQAFREAQAGERRDPPGPFVDGQCGGCSDQGHFMRECPKIEEQIRLGRCKKNQDNKIVLPNGRFIPRYVEGKNFIERLENWYKPAPNPAPAPAAAANVYEREQPPHMLYMAYEEAEEEDEQMAGAMAYQEIGDVPLDELTSEDIEVYLESRKKLERGKAKETFDGVAVPPKPSSRGKKVAFVPPETPVQPPPPPPPPAQPPTFIPISNIPKPFVPKYKAAIEDAVDMQAIVKRALSAKMDLTVEEFFAIYPEARKYMKDQLTSKKVPTVEVKYSQVTGTSSLVLGYQEADGGRREEKLTSSEIDSLRVIDPLVHNDFQVEGILDQGSEIIAMNKDVWLRLGVALNPKKVLNMQSANSQSTPTEGLITGLNFGIGGLDLPFQVHVVQGAPFDLLLGRPFFRFTSCRTFDNLDGSQQITLTCPNTGRVVTIPTRKKTNKSRNPFRPVSEALADFHKAGPRL